jgi:hypothetical protein
MRKSSIPLWWFRKPWCASHGLEAQMPSWHMLVAQRQYRSGHTKGLFYALEVLYMYEAHRGMVLNLWCVRKTLRKNLPFEQGHRKISTHVASVSLIIFFVPEGLNCTCFWWNCPAKKNILPKKISSQCLQATGNIGVSEGDFFRIPITL